MPRVTNYQRVPALHFQHSSDSHVPVPHPRAMLIMGTDVSRCRSSPGTCRGKTDPGNGNTKRGGSIRALVLWSVSVEGWRGAFCPRKEEKAALP